jgi:hypothetical protein
MIVASDFPNTELYIEGRLQKSGSMIPQYMVTEDESGYAILPVLKFRTDYNNPTAREDYSRKSFRSRASQREVKDELDERAIDTDMGVAKASQLITLLNEHTDMVVCSMRQMECINTLAMIIEIKSDHRISL